LDYKYYTEFINDINIFFLKFLILCKRLQNNNIFFKLFFIDIRIDISVIGKRHNIIMSFNNFIYIIINNDWIIFSNITYSFINIIFIVGNTIFSKRRFNFTKYRLILKRKNIFKNSLTYIID